MINVKYLQVRLSFKWKYCLDCYMKPLKMTVSIGSYAPNPSDRYEET